MAVVIIITVPPGAGQAQAIAEAVKAGVEAALQAANTAKLESKL